MSNTSKTPYVPKLPMPGTAQGSEIKLVSAAPMELFAVRYESMDRKTGAPKVSDTLAIRFNGEMYVVKDTDNFFTNVHAMNPDLKERVNSFLNALDGKQGDTQPEATVPVGILSGGRVSQVNKAPR